MSESERHERVALHIRTGDPQTRIFLIDRDFKMVDQGKGRDHTFSVTPGIYKVKVRAGLESEETDVIVRGDAPEIFQEFSAVGFASPAPLEHTLKYHEKHLQHAQAQSRQVHVDAGKGSSIFIFVRDWTGADDSHQNTAESQHPAKSLTLTTTDYELVAHLETDAASELSGDPWAACNIRVDPGNYLLRLELPSGETLEQTVVASPDWQTQIFLLLRHYGRGPQGSSDAGGAERLADLERSSIFLAREDLGFQGVADRNREMELARLGLAHGRMTLSDEAMELLLMGKCENPMLGIYGAHLMLLDPGGANNPDLHQIVRNLRELVGAYHPDVEALAWGIDNVESEYRFGIPPMLQRSWSLVVKSSIEHPELVPEETLAEGVSSRLLREGPWLVWLGPVTQQSSPGDFDPDAEMTQILADMVAQRGRPQWSLPRSDPASIQQEQKPGQLADPGAIQLDPKQDRLSYPRQVRPRTLQDLSKKELSSLAERAAIPMGKLHKMVSSAASMNVSGMDFRGAQAPGNMTEQSRLQLEVRTAADASA